MINIGNLKPSHPFSHLCFGKVSFFSLSIHDFPPAELSWQHLVSSFLLIYNLSFIPRLLPHTTVINIHTYSPHLSNCHHCRHIPSPPAPPSPARTLDAIQTTLCCKKHHILVHHHHHLQYRLCTIITQWSVFSNHGTYCQAQPKPKPKLGWLSFIFS